MRSSCRRLSVLQQTTRGGHAQKRRGWVQAVANVRLTPDPADCSTFRNVAGQSGISNTYSMHGKFLVK